MAPPVTGYLVLQSWAFERNAQGGHNQRQFNVLCGENPPQIVDGYGKWNVIDRPLRQGVTIPQGFNPAKLKVEVIFGIWDGRFGKNGWDKSATAADEVESNIDDLHWMAGGNAIAGPSPVVYMDSYRLAGGKLFRTKLVPPQYWGVPWVITDGITWGNALRLPHGSRAGSRVYQEASFNLLGYTPASGNVLPPPEQTRLAGGFFTVTSTVRTARAIASANSSRVPLQFTEQLATQILSDPRNNPCRSSRLKLERRSIDWAIPVGTAVFVPAHPI